MVMASADAPSRAYDPEVELVSIFLIGEIQIRCGDNNRLCLLRLGRESTGRIYDTASKRRSYSDDILVKRHDDKLL